MLAHRIVDTLWRTKREDARLLNILAQLIDQPIQPLVTGDLGNEAMKTVIGIEIMDQVAFLARFFERPSAIL